MKITYRLFIIVFSIFISLSAKEKSQFSKVKIIFNSEDQITQLAESGLLFDHVQISKEPGAKFSYTTILDTYELNILKNSAISYEVLTADVVQQYKQRQQNESFSKKQLDEEDPLEGFELGSLGGFYTFDEVVTELDSMRMLYPNIITEKDSIGQTHEGRAIWMIKISDNPEQDEDEPQLLYTAMHHAREPGSMMTVMYFMYYLLENYGSDPEVTYLVNNREFYFIPVVNPDGYEYNREMEPAGGYLWRKNKRDNDLDSLFNESFDGVDLNRNYANNWGYDNLGSSPDGRAITYRGPAPFSEPETQAIAELCLEKNFKIALNYHTFGNWLIYPWGYIKSFETPDSNIFRRFANEMTRFNKYIYGTTDQTVKYQVNGNSDDWMYGEQNLKNKIFSMTPEIGNNSDSFWPDPSRIYPQAQENVYPNLFVAWAAGGIIRYVDYSVHYSGTYDYLKAGTENELFFTLKNIGLGNSSETYIRLSSDDSLLTIANESQTISPLASMDTLMSSALKFKVDAAAPSGYIAQLNLEIEQNGVVSLIPVDDLIVGKPVTLFADGFEVGDNRWQMDSPWARTNEKPHTDLFSFSDSPADNYGNNIDNSIYMKTMLNLQNVNAAYLEFWTCWDIEPVWDFAQVQVSVDSIFWTSLQGKYTEPGSGYGNIQQENTFGYDGLQETWVKERINLNHLINHGPVHLRFNIQSDEAVNGDGWYIDDVRVIVYSDSILSTIDEKVRLSHKFALYQNYPNPFNPTTHIRFELEKQAHVKIVIYDALGKKTRTLINEQRAAGQYTLLWNGTNDDGQVVASGIYFYVMSSENFQSRKKLILLR